MRTQGVFLSSVGVFLPDPVSALDAVADGRYDEDVYKASGLTGTHVAHGVSALDMAVVAARRAVQRSGRDVEDIESHVHGGVYHQGPDGSYPPAYILRELGTGPIPSLHIRQGCNGMLAALEVAIGQMTGAAQVETALLTTAQNFDTPLIDRWRGFGDSYILADGAAAAVVSTESGFAEVRSLNSGTLAELEQWHRGDESLLPPQDGTGREVAVAARAALFNEREMSLAETVERIGEFDLSIVRRSLVDAGLNARDIAKVVPINQDGRMIEYAVMGPLGLPMSRSSWDFGRTVGHVGAADLLISLDHLVRTGEVAPGDHVLLLSQGPGWISSAGVVTIKEVPSW
ncbi:ketoacyl-ACP synthase III family protein [Streptomyces sp. NBC_00199]|uniref:ketoacyl-ACP synthase III family protein n=1 Tax=Streptomyces sp. NBC_00199 TaxID=2975678 RepID=UPI002250C688|nr:ketoacyl-ACP synthase III family protein [Streptomyces sp. NBC_00199]MCX5269212.1 ketoacyl-ACP synthase III family protein [Streptomyces sp. NBC_00199]MCX5269778.1 ketoacyl-ACP synthase III family protein [Streptomyces sp. NBC_00199]